MSLNLKNYMNNPSNIMIFNSILTAVLASAMLLRKYMFSDHNHSPSRILIDEYEEDGYENQEFKAVHLYLGNLMASSSRRLQVRKEFDMQKPVTAMEINDEMVDYYENIKARWRLILVPARESNVWNLRNMKAYELTYHKKHHDKVLNSYYPYILQRSKAIKEENKAIHLYAVDYELGISEHLFVFDHPVTFKNLAVDSEKKEAVLDDLNTFKNGEEFYRSKGKAWKRGYLIYGAAGTGKSSLVAAMANHVKYDIYDLDLSGFSVEPDRLWSMAPHLSSRSIVVVEDIEGAFELQNRGLEDGEVSLTVLLEKFWNDCGEERMIVFTANDKNKVETAFSRSGLVDMNIHLSYCTASAFTQLLFNHLGDQNEDALVEDIGREIEEAEITIREVSGRLLNSNDPRVSLRGLRFI